MNYQKKYLKYKKKYLSIKNQIGGMFRIDDRIRELESNVTGVITKIGQDDDPYITMLGDDGVNYMYHKPHFVLLSSESPELKKDRDDERDKIIEKKAQAIINARRRGELFVGDRVRERDSFKTGTITNTFNQFGNLTMRGDDRIDYYHAPWHFSLLERENKEEIEKEKQRRIEEAKRLDERNKQLRREQNFEVFEGDRAIHTDSGKIGTIKFKEEYPYKWSVGPHIKMRADDGTIIDEHESHFRFYDPEVQKFLREWDEAEARRADIRPEAGRADVRPEARTRIAKVSRNDGQASFIKLREEPNASSSFRGSDLPNGTIVDILLEEEPYPGWEYVLGRDTDVRGWVEKIYLQYLLGEARTRIAKVSRNDGQASFIKLREEPNAFSSFIGSDLPNDTIVDILLKKESYPDWEYVLDRDTDVRGWVKKIYLQYL